MKKSPSGGERRVRLTAAEPLGKAPGDKDSAAKKQIPVRKSQQVPGGSHKSRDPEKKPRKTYDPKSSAPIHQILPYVFLVLGVFFAVCFILNALHHKDFAPGESDMGVIGYWLCRICFGILGYGAFALPVLFFSLALMWRRTVDNGTLPVRLILTALTSVVLSAYLHILSVSMRLADDFSPYSIGWLFEEGASIHGGGIVGGVLGQALYDGLKGIGSSIICIAALILLAMFLCGATPVYVWTCIRYRIRKNREKHGQTREMRREIRENQKLANAVLSGGLDPEPQQKKHNGKVSAEEAAGMDTAKPSADSKRSSPISEQGGKRRSRFGEDEELMPVFTDESIQREQPSSGKEEDIGEAELDMSIVYDTPAMREELHRTENAVPLARASGSGHSGADWMSVTADEESESAEQAPVREDNGQAAKEALSAVSDSGEATESARTEDDRIRDLLHGVTVKRAESEAEQYLPEEEPDEPEPVVSDEPEEHPYVCPPVDLLTAGGTGVHISEEEINRSMQTLRNVLQSFNINIKEMAYSCGPTVTRYEIRPEAGTRVRLFFNLIDDISLGLAKSGVRIEAPIPGKPAIGIEVPNDNPATVFLRSMIDTPDFLASKGKLSVCLGEDISGKQVYFDIVKMPHLLIAGATGMGKSVCINCLVTSLLYRFSPEDVRLIMVDPKQVEFVTYKDIPHLFVPIITDPKTATAALAAAIDEMEDRFTKIKDVGARDIRGYNDIAAMDPDVQKMPYIVIIIDELADLMMTASDEVETSICRLAQKARAAGIHLIVGTQRPSVDVVKGTIKSNIPSRIAFTVASQVDSKTILDNAGAEKLIGRGDMLYSPVGAMKPIRVQGAFVSEKEVERITTFVKQNNDSVKYDEQFMKRMTEAAARTGAKKNEGLETDGDSAVPGDDDDKIKAALEIIFDTGRASTSLLQRKLSIGYGRAAKILDMLEEQGFISAQEGTKPRAILITRQEYMERYLNDDDMLEGPGKSSGSPADPEE